MPSRIFDILQTLQIDYILYEHAPVFSVDDDPGIKIDGEHVKSLLLKNKKADAFYMIVVPDYKKLEVNELRRKLGESKLSFVSIELMNDLIGLTPGNVSPYALIQNEQKNITVVFDSCLEGSRIGFHPLENDKTIVTNICNVEKFLQFLEYQYLFVSL